jgi:2-oxoisovalerate dehydrogenase E1 component
MIAKAQAMDSNLECFRRLASDAPDIEDSVSAAAIRQALLIREVEQKFLELFARGAMNGTVHTCVGQEFSAVAVAGQLRSDDWVTSNHRCHGHFIAKTGNWGGLVDELMGLRSGVCMGVGSSQHLFSPGFLSNGPQGSLVPVATGIALHQQRNEIPAITTSFLGEGTLGEGVLYEALNISALWRLPQLFVCENNLYSQSTPQANAVAGTIRGRAEAFGIPFFEADTWSVRALIETAREAIEYVRNERKPAFLAVRTYRLNAHSKGDDDRAADEVGFFAAHDPLNRLLSRSDSWRGVQREIRAELDAYVNSRPKEALSEAHYAVDQLPREFPELRTEVRNENLRMVQALNRAYRAAVSGGAYMIGEDVLDPYGGAFKVTKGLSTAFPQRVLGTPISEAGIAGVAIGVALMGASAYVEIMFGDFTTNIFDQLISNASKFFHMYAFQRAVPVRFRTPMGGKRGYGPTHSQSLEKHLVGIDNLMVVALTSLDDPADTLAALDRLPSPVFIIENKVDYGRFLWQGSPDYRTSKDGGPFGTVMVSPLRHEPTVTVVAYGETAREIADQLEELFVETDCVIELLVAVSLHPLNLRPILESARRTRRVVVVEEGSVAYGIGSEILARLAELESNLNCHRVGAAPVPVPSVLELEKALLPSARKLKTVLASIGSAGAGV